MGIVGCGAIGSTVAQALQRPPLNRSFRIAGLYDQQTQAAAALARQLRGRIPVLPLAMIIRRSDVVLEATSTTAAPAIVTRALRAGRHVVALSVGGVAPLVAARRRTRRGTGQLHIPSGAIGGLDALKAARLGTLRRVTLTTRKPPRALAGAPGLRLAPQRLAQFTRPRVVFHGSAAAAMRAFPQNINVAATLALAGIGPQRTTVTIIADPRVRRNIHELEAVGSFGRLTVRLENVPSPRNPKTSELAILSALATLEQLATPERVGT